MTKKELKILIETYPKNTFTRVEKAEFNQYREHLNEFSAMAMLKYLKGRVEHGQRPDDIDCDIEIDQEIADITAYRFIKTLQR